MTRFEKTPIFDRSGLAPTSDAIATLPNLLTFLRMLCIPFFLWLMHVKHDPLRSSLLLFLLGSTDWIDGYLARLLNQRTRFGRIFDPTVDRLMFVVIVSSMIITGAIPAWFLGAILVRDISVSTVSLYNAIRLGRTLDVSWWGKVATFGLLMSLPSLLAANAPTALASYFNAFGWAVGIPSLVISWITGASYLHSHWKARTETSS